MVPFDSKRDELLAPSKLNCADCGPAFLNYFSTISSCWGADRYELGLWWALAAFIDQWALPKLLPLVLLPFPAAARRPLMIGLANLGAG